MKLKFTIDLEDFFIFSDHLIKTSSLLRKTIRKGQMWWASGPLVAGLVLAIAKGHSPEKTLMLLATLSFAISIPMFFIYTQYFRCRNKTNIKKLHKNGRYNDVLGAHEMTITNGQLTEKTTANNIKIEWHSIKKIKTTDSHTFIFTDDVTAYIIPHKKITEGNAPQFINALNAAFEKAAGCSGTDTT